MTFPRGSLMLEALLAVGIGGLFVAALAGYILLASASTDRSKKNAEALWATQEGLDALQTIDFPELANTINGAITFTNGTWILSTDGPQSLADGITRTLKIEDISRDANCFVVSSGGTVDEDSKKLTSTTTWTDSRGNNHIAELSTLRTHWESPSGACFAPTQVSQVDFNISGAVFSGGKQLREVYFTNNGSAPVTIDQLMFTWDNGAELTQVFMDTSKVWSESGPGTPLGDAYSGTILDIQNFVLAPGATAELNKGQFDKNMSGVAMTLTVTFTDGSVWASPSFNPL